MLTRNYLRTDGRTTDESPRHKPFWPLARRAKNHCLIIPHVYFRRVLCFWLVIWSFRPSVIQYVITLHWPLLDRSSPNLVNSYYIKISWSLFIFKVIGQRSSSKLDLEYFQLWQPCEHCAILWKTDLRYFNTSRCCTDFRSNHWNLYKHIWIKHRYNPQFVSGL